jgi:hypothetical protein
VVSTVLKRTGKPGYQESERNHIESNIIYAKKIREPGYIRDVSFEKKNMKTKKERTEYITDFPRLAVFTSSSEQDKCTHFRVGLNKGPTRDLRWVPPHSKDTLIKDSIRFQSFYEIETATTDQTTNILNNKRHKITTPQRN